MKRGFMFRQPMFMERFDVARDVYNSDRETYFFNLL